MRRTLLAALGCVAASAGCAVIKTTDVTDASFKRYQSIAVLGWPLYARVTDGGRNPSAPPRLAIKEDGVNRAREVQPAELLELSQEEPVTIGEKR